MKTMELVVISEGKDRKNILVAAVTL